MEKDKFQTCYDFIMCSRSICADLEGINRRKESNEENGLSEAVGN